MEKRRNKGCGLHRVLKGPNFIASAVTYCTGIQSFLVDEEDKRKGRDQEMLNKGFQASDLEARRLSGMEVIPETTTPPPTLVTAGDGLNDVPTLAQPHDPLP